MGRQPFRKKQMDLIIRDDEGHILYGHQTLRRIIQTGKGMDYSESEGITAECYLAYIHAKFPDLKEVRALRDSGMIDADLLEAVSDRIELTTEDVENMEKLNEKSI
jgi:hypothetical protein